MKKSSGPNKPFKSSPKPAGRGQKKSSPPGTPRTAATGGGASRRQDHASADQNSYRSSKGGLWLYGRHAVLAALTNPARTLKRIIVADRQAREYQDALGKIVQEHDLPPVELLPAAKIEDLLPDQAVHQGIALLTTPLADLELEDICPLKDPDMGQLVVVLDQVTDPQNVGAIIRSASAFGATALITTDRNTPPESGALAKSASGALEVLPWIRVTNLARALDQLAELGYWRIGLDGYAKTNIDDADLGKNLVLVMGAEGAGLRKGTKDHCDLTVRLPITRAVESLNVSNAAAIALYDFSRRIRS